MLRALTLSVWTGMLLLATGAASAQAPFVPVDPMPTAMEARIQGALETVTDVEFDKTPLNDAADFLAEQNKIPVMIDTDALEAEGVRDDVPVTLHAEGIRLRSVLRLILDKLQLTYAVHDEVLMITTRQAARQMTSTRVYDVSKVLELGESAEDLARTLDETLAARPTQTLTAEPAVMTPDQVLAMLHSTDAESEARRITAYGQMLIVRDTTTGHEQIDEVLRALQASVVRRAVELQRAQQEAMRATDPQPQEREPDDAAPMQPRNGQPRNEQSQPSPKST